MIRILALIFVFFLVSSCQTIPRKEVAFTSPPKKEIISGAPKNAILLDHKYFVISYNPVQRLPYWVLYSLEASHVGNKQARRKNKFFADPLLIAMGLPAVQKTDYEGRKYDRGHLAPSEDFIWNQEANDVTFVMTNMVPQKGSLNRGSWKVLESKVRRWACTEKEVRVVAGPLFSSYLAPMKSGVPVPEKFFKVILDETPPRKAIAFIFSQEDGRVDYSQRAVTMETVEKATGLRFFNDIPERDKISKSFRLNDWKESTCGHSAQ